MAMSKAMSTMGGVIDLGCRHHGRQIRRSMLSGVNTLLQIGAGIVIGLVLYSTVFMGLVVPALCEFIWRSQLVAVPRKREAIQAQTAKGSLEEKSSRLIKQT